jgi:dsDNA-specific endonuclease/ATPase MutS2
MKTIVATFTGHNGSCGYETNKEYALTIYHYNDVKNKKIVVEKSGKNGEGYCEYDSIISFFNNWNKIKVLD